MLKFLDNSAANNRCPQKPVIKFLPGKAYGNSFESPAQFQHNHTIFDKQSYVNPYVSFEKERLKYIPEGLKANVQPKWIKRTSLHESQENNIFTGQQPQSGEERCGKSTLDQNEVNNLRYRLSKGEFTGFLDKNKDYRQMGPLFGINRNKISQQAAAYHKLSLNVHKNSLSGTWNRSNRISNDPMIQPSKINEISSHQKLVQLKQGSNESQQKFSQTKNKSLYSSGNASSLGSLLINKSIQKQRIKKSRQQLSNKFSMDLINRKKIRTKQFELPKFGAYGIISNAKITKSSTFKREIIRASTRSSVDNQILAFQNFQSSKLK